MAKRAIPVALNCSNTKLLQGVLSTNRANPLSSTSGSGRNRACSKIDTFQFFLGRSNVVMLGNYFYSFRHL